MIVDVWSMAVVLNSPSHHLLHSGIKRRDDMYGILKVLVTIVMGLLGTTGGESLGQWV